MPLTEDFAFVLLYLGAFGLSDYVFLKKLKLFSSKQLFYYYTVFFLLAVLFLNCFDVDNIFYHLAFILIYIAVFGFSDLVKLKLSESFYTLYYICLFFTGLFLVFKCRK